MKLINERGKLFGLINLVDLVLLLVIVLGIVAVGYKMLQQPIQEAVSKEVPVTVTLRVRGAMPFLVDEMIEKIQAGDRLVSGNGFDNAEVLSVEAIPYEYTDFSSDGVGVYVTDPAKSDVIVKVRAYGVEDAAIFKIGTQEVRTGRGFNFKTNRFEVDTIIESVEFDG